MTKQELRQWLKRHDMTQEELARACGVHRITVAKWLSMKESGRGVPPWLPVVLRCLDVLKKAGKA